MRVIFILALLLSSPYAWASKKTFDFEMQFLNLFIPGEEELVTLSNGETYSITKFLGEGYMAQVYEAKDSQGKIVALKFLAEGIEAENVNFLREEIFSDIKKLTNNSDDFADIYGYSSVVFDDHPDKRFRVFIFEKVEGENLRRDPRAQKIEAELLNFSGTFDLAEEYPGHRVEKQKEILTRIERYVDFGIRVVQRLVEFETIFGDLNPKNIMLTPEGNFKVIDTDSMLSFESHRLCVQDSYMPQECSKGKAVLGASDLYSVGGAVGRFLLGSPFIQDYLKSEELTSQNIFRVIEGKSKIDFKALGFLDY